MKVQININDAATLIAAIGATNTVIIQGEPGTGKSSLLYTVADRLNMEPRYVDCTLLDVGDVQMPKVGDDSVRFVPNSLFVSDKPIVVMLDEIGKAARTVQNAMLTLLLEQRIGTYRLPEGSVVFGTTNLSTDGIGDAVQAHARNRVSMLTMAKPNAEEWCAWAANNDVNPAVTAWVREYPHCLASYLDGESANDNPYIFNPHRQQAAFVSPRSLAAAGRIVDKATAFDPMVLITALAGTVGEAAARDMEAFIAVGSEITGLWDKIVASPDTAPVPSNAIATIVLAHGALQRIDNATVDAWLTYLARLPRETQFMFTSMARTVPAALKALVGCAKFRQWAIDNHFAY